MKRICLTLLLMLLFPATARAEILLGVSDSGKAEDYYTWSEGLDRPVPALQTFHTWGTSLRKASARWQELEVLPVLHVSTNHLQDPPSLAEIARGEEDQYLLRLRQEIFAWGGPLILRPLGEPNRLLNAYSAFLPGGESRGWEFSAREYRRAFQRISVVVRSQDVLGDLQRLGLPLISGTISPPGTVQILWSPLPGREGIPGNGPHQFWPGRQWVDLAGTSFFSAWPHWKDLSRMQKRWRKPFWLAEWGLNSGKPRFVRQVYKWCLDRCQGMIYYQGFGDEAYKIDRYPLALQTMRNLSRDLLRYPLTASA